MTARILRREAAKRDLDHHAAFIQQSSPESAIRFLDAARDAIQLLAHMPELGSLCEFRNRKASGMRAWTIKGFANYVIFYRSTASGLEIVRVLHAAQDRAGIFELFD